MMLSGTATIGRSGADVLSQNARKALLDAGRSREGATVQGPAAAVQELQLAGYAGARRGLTRAGAIMRERVVEAMERELF